MCRNKMLLKRIVNYTYVFGFDFVSLVSMFPRNTVIYYLQLVTVGQLWAFYLYPSKHTDLPLLFRLCFANVSQPEKDHLRV